MTRFYVTEIDNKPIAGQGWFDSRDAAFAAARDSVRNSDVPTFVAVVGDWGVELRVARVDSEFFEHADELIDKPIPDLPPGDDGKPTELPDPPAPGADDI